MGESIAPVPRPLLSTLCKGRWNVVYTESLQLRGSDLPRWLRPQGPLYLTLEPGNVAAGRAELEASWPATTELARCVALNDDATMELTSVETEAFGFIRLPGAGRQREYSSLKTTFVDLDLRLLRDDAERLYVLLLDDPRYEIGRKGAVGQLSASAREQ